MEDWIVGLLQSERTQGVLAGGIITAVLGYLRHRQVLRRLESLSSNLQSPLAVLIDGTMRDSVRNIRSRKDLDSRINAMKRAARDFDMRGHGGNIIAVIHAYEYAMMEHFNRRMTKEDFELQRQKTYDKLRTIVASVPANAV